MKNSIINDLPLDLSILNVLISIPLDPAQNSLCPPPVTGFVKVPMKHSANLLRVFGALLWVAILTVVVVRMYGRRLRRRRQTRRFDRSGAVTLRLHRNALNSRRRWNILGFWGLRGGGGRVRGRLLVIGKQRVDGRCGGVASLRA